MRRTLHKLFGAGMTLLLAGLLTGAPSVSAATVFDEPLTYFNPATWQKADGYSNGSMFNCTWRANNISFTSGGQLRLALTSPSNNKFDGAEYRSVYKYGYGKYEVSMKPPRTAGSSPPSSPTPGLQTARPGMRLILSSSARIPPRSNSTITRTALAAMRRLSISASMLPRAIIRTPSIGSRVILNGM